MAEVPGEIKAVERSDSPAENPQVEALRRDFAERILQITKVEDGTGVDASVTLLTADDINRCEWRWSHYGISKDLIGKNNIFYKLTNAEEGEKFVNGVLYVIPGEHAKHESQNMNVAMAIPKEKFNCDKAFLIRRTDTLPRDQHGSDERKFSGIGCCLVAKAVAESLERGWGGKVYTCSLRADPFWESLGMSKVEGTSWYYFTEEQAQAFLRRVLDEHARIPT